MIQNLTSYKSLISNIIILDAKHEKIARNNPDFFLVLSETFKIQWADTFGYKRGKKSWLFQTIFFISSIQGN